jgi:solute carrier family 10 (sodium/bile acid cotransporter), member 7
MSLKRWFTKYWFMLALMLLALITMADTHQWTVSAGRYLKGHAGPDIVIFFIFFFSGLALDARLLRKGLGDFRASLAALLLIFLFAPLIALGFGYLPLDIQILTGLFLVAVMPSTLSTGVVMTQASGGNMAHALFITILANILAVFTIPLVLSLLLGTLGDVRSIQIDKVAIMLKIAGLVLAPLAAGVALQYAGRRWIAPLQRRTPLINQLLVLAIVWMGMTQSRAALMAGGRAILPIAAAAGGFHLLLVLTALALCKFFVIGPRRRESVIFMGGQKTLPLSVILQVTLFPEYGLALAFCVVHHVLHLIMDAYLVEKLKPHKRLE